MPQRRLNQHAVVIRRDDFALGIPGDHRSRVADPLQATKVIGETEVHAVGNHWVSDLQTLLGCRFFLAEKRRYIRLDDCLSRNQEAGRHVEGDPFTGFRKVLAGLDQQRILGAGGIAESAVVTHAPAVGVAGVCDDGCRYA